MTPIRLSRTDESLAARWHLTAREARQAIREGISFREYARTHPAPALHVQDQVDDQKLRGEPCQEN